MKPKKFTYRCSVKWTGEKRGVLSSPGKSDIEVATPPEFRGHEGVWTPEELFIASVNICIKTTFLHYAEKNDFEILSYESEAEGVLEKVGDRFMFSEIKVRPRICVGSGAEIDKAKEFIELSEKNCLISNSVESRVEVLPEISVGG
jgi:organic hydroperoxide reductase OsmC/OhrA